MIELRNVKKIYKSKKSTTTTALDNVNIKIDKAGMLFIVGKSGSGKSTLLNLLGGLDNLTSGELLINGKNISDFNKTEYDSYRNTYVGFIFQEFNILEQYNVYENIELSTKLQNQTTSREDIDELLNKLGLNDLGSRKINELSGGQKQRVAIARALIKKPKIILADEPTGNLDMSSSEQIFNILKDISKKQLVIVVSHDMESAEKYADRIIQIEDGKVVKDSNEFDEIGNDLFELKKSKLPLSYALKMAITSFKTKPTKLFMTVLLTAVSLIFMGITVNCALFDKTMLITDTMKSNSNYIYDMQKFKLEAGVIMDVFMLEENDMINIKSITKSKLNPVYSLYDNGDLLRFSFGPNDRELPYYPTQIFSVSFVEVKDSRLFNNLIGKSPVNSNEIVVHKYFADYVIKFGIMTPDNNLYFPADYNELVSSKTEIKLGDNKVFIVGIIDDDDSLFANAKRSGKFGIAKLKDYFYLNYVMKGYTVYVNGFTDNAILGTDKNSLLKYMTIKDTGISEKQRTLSSNINILSNQTNIVTKNGIVPIKSLEKNEIVISIEALRTFDDDFNSKFNKYLETHSDRMYEELLKEFTVLYLKDSTRIPQLYLGIYLRDFSYENEELNIIGVSLDGNNYVSHKYTDEYTPISKKVYSVKVFDDNINNLTRTFKNLVFRDFTNYTSGIHYGYTVDNYSDLSNVMVVYKELAVYILIVSLVFVIFTFLLFSNFITVSISYCKKEIGILRALGARSRDVIKIFGYESIIIGILAWILAIIGWFIVCGILNDSIFGSMYYTLNGIVTQPLVPIIMLIYTIAIALLVTIASMSRITAIKPIDAILNK